MIIVIKGIVKFEQNYWIKQMQEKNHLGKNTQVSKLIIINKTFFKNFKSSRTLPLTIFNMQIWFIISKCLYWTFSLPTKHKQRFKKSC